METGNREATLIPKDDLKFEVLRQDQRGGQHVGTDPCDIRVTHVPTGIIATCGFSNSQHRNRSIALEMIEAALTSPNFK